MNRLSAPLLALLLATPLVAAQHIPPHSLPPPISPPLLARPAYDPHPPAPSSQPESVPATEPETPPPFDPPESGLECTPGHVIVGCVQVPIFQERGPYSQAPRWPGVIPYEYDGNVTQASRTLFDAAMAEVESYCNVDFVPREWFHTSWLHIQTSNASNAPIGLGPGERIVNISNFNIHYTSVHELFHVLGVYHEQSRTDRNTFVTINTASICQDCCMGGPCNSQFEIEASSGSIGLYNFDSFMHYPATAFSTGGNTITVQPAFAAIWQNRIGQRSHWSFGDRSTAIFLHQPGWAKIAQIGGSNGPGTWANPFNNFPDAYNAAPTGGDVILRSGYFTGLGLRTKAMRIHAPDGGVRIGQ
ncbi:MAG: hypothetical protein HUU18_08540 [Phycisphaerales bacterium]|nr:hypothetical protein [Phycisphaerales bacterium]